MNVQVKALSSFYHGNMEVKRGDQVEFNKAVAADLEKAGLVEITGDVASEAPAKMEPAPKNKMISSKSTSEK